jgi:hypothetical protein
MDRDRDTAVDIIGVFLSEEDLDMRGEKRE